jgi:hypothetical protein
MTDAERTAWLALYAAAWFQPTAPSAPGWVKDEHRAQYAAMQADRALEALRAARPDVLR